MLKSDVSKSGDLDLNEFVNYLQEHEKQLKIVFSTLDEDQDGKISIGEVVSAFNRLGIIISDDEAKLLLKRYDDVLCYFITIIIQSLRDRCCITS
jgi:solute carrier family 25 phosphate transporter 23/24/25/41